MIGIRKWLVLCSVALASFLGVARSHNASADDLLEWSELPSIPGELGVAGPFAGIHNDALIVAGGANFAKPVWENDKAWHDAIYVLPLGDQGELEWSEVGRLPRPTAYGAAVSTPSGVICLGGNDSTTTFEDVYRLQYDGAGKVSTEQLPPLPKPCAFTSAAVVGSTLYVVAGQSGNGLDTATSDLWSLDLSAEGESDFGWKVHDPMPAPTRALHIAAAQHNGFHDCLYVISGRRQEGEATEFLKDVWEYCPATRSWRERTAIPHCVMAGTGIGFGQSHLFVLGGADGSFWGKENDLLDDHPGFPKRAYSYHTITDTWIDAGPTPRNHVTTVAVDWGDSIIIPSGEVCPRVRSPKVWKVTPRSTKSEFGTVNYVVLVVYLLAIVAVGIYFAGKNKDTNDYFRGGKAIPWWAAGCSIFATMLSSLTYTGVPSKSYAQDCVYAVGNFMIPVVAIVAVYVALPFYRRIDATSAYEYLEKRFNRMVRWFGSVSFTLFHIFRMAVVMSLTGLAIAVATPLTPTQSVLLMGVLSIVYCTMGGIEAVIWTDTIQTFVLMGGACVAIYVLVAGIDGGASGFVATASEADKFRIANFGWDATSTQVALWVIIIGGIGQNLSSYTGDQAVVQRYMTTPSQKLAARSIWTNAALTIPATILFFGIGAGLFAFYKSHPERLDPTMTTDQVFPLFIAREMPIGLAGLIVAGVFAAAQSTVSTSMNSTATTIVTDFFRPLELCRTEAGYLSAARWITFSIGVAGTLIALLFLNDNIKSLFDEFLMVIGVFMGVLGGLFVLGALTKHASGPGALVGALAGAAIMIALWYSRVVSGYLFTTIGITTCFLVGYVASYLLPASQRDLDGLTIYTMK